MKFIVGLVVALVVGTSRGLDGGGKWTAVMLALDDLLIVGVLEVTLCVGFERIDFRASWPGTRKQSN